MSNYKEFDFGDRSIVVEDSLLLVFYEREVTEAVELNPAEALNLASALLQYATQNREANE